MVMPGRFMILLLLRRRVQSESVLDVEAESSVLHLVFLDGNMFGRNAAGMYIGRTCRAWKALGDVGFDESGLLSCEVLSGDI